MSDSVLAVVVTYNPQRKSLQALLAAISPQVAKVVVVDNASSNLSDIKAELSVYGKAVSLHELKINKGLGVAHNIGIKLANDESYEYVLLLDQDSIAQADMVANLVSAHKKCSAVEKVSAVGASYINQDNNSQSFFVRFGKLKFQRFSCGTASENVIAADFLISSGSLFSTDTLNQVGNMDESLFIDHVDTEWFLRAKSKGFNAFGVCNAKMKHDLGEITHRIKLRRERNVPQHKPFRYYYIFRNSVLLYKRGYCSALWKWNDLQRLLSIALMYGVFVPPRLEHLKMMCRGVKDGILGKTGAM